MKKDIHPELHKITVRCSCGHEFQTLSTVKAIHVAVCSNCHPFFTGKQKIVDTAGRVERFKQRYARKKEPEKKKAPRTITIS